MDKLSYPSWRHTPLRVEAENSGTALLILAEESEYALHAATPCNEWRLLIFPKFHKLLWGHIGFGKLLISA